MVVLRLCRRTLLGATFVKVVSVGGRLYLSGLEPSLIDYLDAEAGWSRGATNEPALGHLGYPAIIRSGRGEAIRGP